MRTTKKQLERYINYINNFSSKKYILEGAYGKVCISMCINGKDTRDGVVHITPFLTKGQLNVVIDSIFNYIMSEKRGD